MQIDLYSLQLSSWRKKKAVKSKFEYPYKMYKDKPVTVPALYITGIRTWEFELVTTKRLLLLK